MEGWKGGEVGEGDVEGWRVESWRVVWKGRGWRYEGVEWWKGGSEGRERNRGMESWRAALRMRLKHNIERNTTAKMIGSTISKEEDSDLNNVDV